jgi:hypothetical protein
VPSAKAIEMHTRRVQRLFARVGSLLLVCASAACTDGTVQLTLLSAAGGAADGLAGAGAGGKASGGRGGFGGRGADPRDGASGGPPRVPYPCENEPWDPEDEKELRETLSDAYSSGRYCPRTPSEDWQPLELDPELQWQARASVCIAGFDFGWFRAREGFGWVLVGTPNVEDAKKALLGAPHQELCDEAQVRPFRHIGVGHSRNEWSVFIAPDPPEDMQNR